MTHDMTDSALASDPSPEQAAPPWYDLPPEAANREALEDSIAELAAQLDAASFRLLRLIRAYDARGLWAAAGARSCSDWLSFRIGWGAVTAREKLRVAQALDELPCIREAFAQGRLSYSKVRSLTRVATAANEAELLTIATAGTAHHVDKLARLYRKVTGEQERQAALRQQQQRYLRMRTDAEGMLVISGRLPPEVGAALKRALEAACQAIKSEEPREPDETAQAGSLDANDPASPDAPCGASPPQRSLALATAALGLANPAANSASPNAPGESPVSQNAPRGASASQNTPGESPASPNAAPEATSTTPRGAPVSQNAPRGASAPQSSAAFPPSPQPTPLAPPSGFAWIPPAEQLQADALALICETALPHLGRSERCESYQVVLHVDAEVLADPEKLGHCHLDDGPALAAETARRLSCDCDEVTLHQARGPAASLDAGRRTRRISLRLWRALLARDQTCQFPGCSCSRQLKAHHIRHWSAGGPTDRENLVLLCQAHHTLVHEGGFTVEGLAPDRLRFYTPEAKLLPQAPPPPPPLSADPLDTLRAQQAELAISADTPATWRGDRMDYGWAIDSLLRANDRADACTNDHADDHAEAPLPLPTAWLS